MSKTANAIALTEAAIRAIQNPFTPTTTQRIERANRLMALRAHPGFLDLVRLSLDLVKEPADILVDFNGWDPMQITLLKARAQAAKEHHDMLMAKIQEAIQGGIAEAAEQDLATKSPQEIVEQSDRVRAAVLSEFKKMDENRIPGSYNPEE